MIRIGFSAVVLLLIIYVFRFFFVPSISVVATDELTTDKNKSAVSDINIDELAELQAEIDTLKVKLKEAEDAKKSSPVSEASVASTTAAAATAPDLTSETPAGEEAVANSSQKENPNFELKEKLKTLEARLSEYEIIAEEIAEIGKLREENVKLKARVEALDNDQVVTADLASETSIEVAGDVSTELQEEVLSVTSDQASEAEAILGELDGDDVSLLLDSDVTEDLAKSKVDADLYADEEIEKVTGEAPSEKASELVKGSAPEPESSQMVTGQALEEEPIKMVTGQAPEEEPAIMVTSSPKMASKAGDLLIQSDVEVSDEEKSLVNSFEDFKISVKG